MYDRHDILRYLSHNLLHHKVFYMFSIFQEKKLQIHSLNCAKNTLMPDNYHVLFKIKWYNFQKIIQLFFDWHIMIYFPGGSKGSWAPGQSLISFLTSDFWCQISDVRSLMSDFWCQISDVRFLMPDFWGQISNVRFLMPNFWCQISDVRSLKKWRMAAICSYNSFRWEEWFDVKFSRKCDNW